MVPPSGLPVGVLKTEEARGEGSKWKGLALKAKPSQIRFPYRRTLGPRGHKAGPRAQPRAPAQPPGPSLGPHLGPEVGAQVGARQPESRERGPRPGGAGAARCRFGITQGRSRETGSVVVWTPARWPPGSPPRLEARGPKSSRSHPEVLPKPSRSHREVIAKSSRSHREVSVLSRSQCPLAK